MRLSTLLTALAIVSAAPAAALACDAGNPAARPLPSPTGEMTRDLSMTFALGAAAKPQVYAYRALEKAADACDRGGFQAGGRAYRLSGSGGAVVRLAIPVGGGPIVYLAPFRDQDGRGGARFALAVAEPEANKVVALLDGVPDDASLARLMAQVLESPAPAIVAFNRRTGQLQTFVADESAGFSSLEPAPGDGLRHIASGFICPGALSGVRRDRAVAYDSVSPGGEGLSCRFSGQGVWLSVYVSRLPAGATDAALFADQLAEAQRIDTPSAALENILPPGAGPAFGETWRDDLGQIQGLWQSSVGGWSVTLRASWRPGGERTVRSFATSVYQQASAQIGSPAD